MAGDNERLTLSAVEVSPADLSALLSARLDREIIFTSDESFISFHAIDHPANQALMELSQWGVVLSTRQSDDKTLLSFRASGASAGAIAAALGEASGRHVTFEGGGPFNLEIKDVELPQILANIARIGKITVDSRQVLPPKL